MALSVPLSRVRRIGRRRPNVNGDLAQLLSEAPCFRRRAAGYDRLQVDNYTAWAEAEIALAGRQLDQLARRLGGCTAELAQAEQRLATSPAGWELGRVSERMGEVLRLAADEAADLVEAGSAERERLRADGVTAAAVAMGHAHAVHAQAVADSDRVRALAETTRRTAEAELARTRRESALLLRLAAAQHATAVAEVAEAHRAAERERQAAHAELLVAQARRAQAEQVVARLTGELESALGDLTSPPTVLSVVPDAPELPVAVVPAEHRTAS